MKTPDTTPKPSVIEAGQITTLGLDGDRTEYQRAIVIEFADAEQLREAIKTGRVEFTVFGAHHE